ncbi:hypothetical protein ACFFQW_47270 [Umezawaea endophytica]|uniref:Uncharacterized protein n=1 Tax=Umezawaea endophytica TaxID=1654476 RepID=A0A9X2VJ25_9PSEU|nr:hypothetical protein [Umezawaea endophytica]MCS7477476.1 hypothetical protein [Umezawaea endophytica]
MGAGQEARGHLDQIVFGFVDSGAGGAMDIAWTTFPTTSSRVAVWKERLRNHVRLHSSQVGGQSYLPDHSLSYLEFGDGSAALLRRTNEGEAGRNWSHAIVGSASDLGQHAAALWDWRRWQEGSSAIPLDTLHVDALHEHHAAVAPELDRRSLRQRHYVVPVVRALLADPLARLTVLDAPEHAVAELVWLSRRITEPLLPAWTFSTYEVTDGRDVPDLPSVLFLRAAPLAGETGHRRLYLDEALAGDGAADAAERLVSTYVEYASTGRLPEYRAWVADLVGGAPDRVGRVVRALGGAEPAAARQFPAPPDEDLTMITPVVPPTFGVPLDHGRSEDDRPPTEPRPAVLWHKVPHDRLVVVMANEEDVAAGLAEMEARLGQPTPEERQAIRGQLVRNDYLTAVVEGMPDQGDEHLWNAALTIMRFGYGQKGEDLVSTLAVIALKDHLLTLRPGSLFLHAAYHLCVDNGTARQFDELVGWMLRRKFPAPDALRHADEPPLGFAVANERRHSCLKTTAARYRWEAVLMTPPVRQRGVLLALAGVLLVVGFLAGLLL